MNIVKKLIIISFLLSVTFTQTLALQGVLREPTGNTVEDGYFKMTFKLYTDENGGTEIWEEVHPSVPVKNGVYAVELGSINAFTGLSFSVQYYVGVSIEEDPELVPRVKLTNSPTALAVFGDENIFPSSGNVGVGTTDPNALLNISQTGSEDLLNIENGSGGLIVNADGNVGIGTAEPTATIEVITDDDSDLINISSATENFIVNADGNVGIGTAEPTATMEVITDDDSDLINISSATENFIVKSSGNVGIGVANPSATLDIENSGNTDLLNLKNGDDVLKVDADGIMHIPNSINFPDGSVLTTAQGTTASSLTSPGNTDIVADDDDNGSGDIQFRNGSSTNMVVTNAGNVGIGTTEPSAKLDVDGTSEFNGNLFINGATQILKANENNPSNPGDIIFRDFDNVQQGRVITNVNGMYLTTTDNDGDIAIDTDGNVGIGTASPSAKLDVDGDATISGNVGIGLTAPANQLEVRDIVDDIPGLKVSRSESQYLTLQNENANGAFITAVSAHNNTKSLNIGSYYDDSNGEPSVIHANIYFKTGALSTENTRMTIKGESGNVGIGTTSPGVKLQIEGGSDVDDETANSGYQIIGDPADRHLAFDDNEIMAKSSANEVGTLYIQNEGGLTQFDGPVDIQEWAETEGFTGNSILNNQYQLSDDNSGYVKIGNLILQWGTASVGDNAHTVTYPIAFPNACFNVQTTRINSGGEKVISVNNVKNSTFIIDRANSMSGTDHVMWMAIGF